jgi:hypothetical protein
MTKLLFGKKRVSQGNRVMMLHNSPYRNRSKHYVKHKSNNSFQINFLALHFKSLITQITNFFTRSLLFLELHFTIKNKKNLVAILGRTT